MKPLIRLPGLVLPLDAVITRVSVTDQSGFENDRLEVELDNSKGNIVLPAENTEIAPEIGYAFMPGADPYYNGVTARPGKFFVDEVEFSGPPDKVSIYAHSAFMGGKHKDGKTRDWHGKTLGEIARQIASENGFTAVVEESLDGVKIAHRDQTEQSDMSFLAKLAEESNGVLKVHDGRMMLVTRGKPTEAVIVKRSALVKYSGLAQKRSEYDGVKARYHDYTTGKEVVLVAGEQGDRLFNLKEQFKNEEEALAAAQSRREALNKEGETFTFSCVGDPRLKAEAMALIEGFLPNVRPLWLIDRVTHTLSGQGYVTTCDCVSPDKEGENRKETGESNA